MNPEMKPQGEVNDRAAAGGGGRKREKLMNGGEAQLAGTTCDENMI